MKANTDIRAAARNNGVYLWEIASALGVAESTLIRHLRDELTADRKAEIMATIQTIHDSKVTA